jgi:16S rRNA (guanine1207-N2)-methyltransferase
MIRQIIKGHELSFETAPGLFSPGQVDKGTLLMLEAAEFKPGETVLDLGCGYGAVGITAARILGAEHVTMCDISDKAVIVARRNAALNGVPDIGIYLSDGFDAVPGAGFSQILCNPPYHADFSVPKRFIEKGFHRLMIGGRMLMVTKRLDWYRNKMRAVFGGVRVSEADGYYLFTAERRGRDYGRQTDKRK